MKYKWKLFIFIPLAVILAFGLYKGRAHLSGGKIPQHDPVQTVEVKKVARVKEDNALSLTGTLEAFNESVISPKVAGRVSGIEAEDGDAVSPGQTLVALDRSNYKNQLDASRAGMQKAQAALASARANYNRLSVLHQQGVLSDKDFEDAGTMLEAAEADAGSAAAALANAEDSYKNTDVVSPLEGVLSNRNVDIGQVVSPGQPLMMVEDISSVYAVVNVEQKDIGRIKPGLEASVTVDAYPGQTFTGTVEIINPVADKSTRVFETKIKVDNQKRLLKPGMFVEVKIRDSEAGEVLAVPCDAVTSDQGMYFVFVAEGDKVKRQQVEIGQTIGQLVEIKSGLSEGQPVVVTNVNKLKDLDSIKIAD